jgi:hypothetical protein
VIEGLLKPFLAAVSIRGWFTTIAIPAETYIEKVSVPCRVCEDSIIEYVPIAGDVFEPGAEALIADFVAATSDRFLRRANIRIRCEIQDARPTAAVAEVLGCLLTALAAKIETPIKAIIILPPCGV